MRLILSENDVKTIIENQLRSKGFKFTRTSFVLPNPNHAFELIIENKELLEVNDVKEILLKEKES